MLARVLVLQEKTENVANIQTALPDCDLYVVHDVEHALNALHSQTFDLVVSAVHLEFDGSVFDFLKACKEDAVYSNVPFVFYCAKSSTFARSVRDGLQIAARALGADKYIVMEEFSEAILRFEILSVLPHLSDSAASLSHLNQGGRAALTDTKHP